MKPSKIGFCLPLVVILLCGGCGKGGAANGTVSLPSSWAVFIASETIPDGCEVVGKLDSSAPSGAGTVLQMSSVRPARFAVTPAGGSIPVQPGERYRLSAWVKAGKDFQLVESSTGVMLRGTVKRKNGLDHENGHFYVGVKGLAIDQIHKLLLPQISDQWQKIEGVVEIPAEAASMKFFVFCWWTQGTVYIDGATMERVSDPPTTAL